MEEHKDFSTTRQPDGSWQLGVMEKGLFYTKGAENKSGLDGTILLSPTDTDRNLNLRINGELNATIRGFKVNYGQQALSFFEADWMTATQNKGMHEYTFTDGVSLEIQEAMISLAAMDGDGKDNPGLFLSNKKKHLTFEDSVRFRINYDAINSKNSNQTKPVVLSGIYNGFGASMIWGSDKETVEQKAFLNNLFGQNESLKTAESVDFDGWRKSDAFKKGRTYFKGGLDLWMLNDIRQEGEGDDYYAAAYGIYINEGGGVYIDNYANLILITSPKADHVSNIHLSSHYGIRDPFKEGEFRLENLTNTSRLWAFSSEEPIDYYDTPEEVQGHTFRVRNAVESLHGGMVTLKDSATGSGWLDIRGNIVASGEAATWNQTHVVEGGTVGNDKITGKVTNAFVTLHLSNPNSKLFGNVYERHRLGADEALTLAVSDSASQQVFDAWITHLREEAAKGDLGGRVDLTLAGGASWYPLQGWYGWDASVATEKNAALDASLEKWEPSKDGSRAGENEADHLQLNRLDQYNLYKYDENGKKVAVNALKDGYQTALNDNDLTKKTEADGICYVDREAAGVDELVKKSNADINAPEVATVSNGIYRLNLEEGAQVDTRFMRMDFGTLIGVKETGPNFHDEMIDLSQNTQEFEREGVKSLRIQELKGSGQFNLYVKDRSAHDLLIVDEAEESTGNRIVFWNLLGATPDLGIKADDESTFIQIARADKGMTFRDHVLYRGKNSVFQWRYSLVKDEDLSISKAQGALIHDQTDNWFLVASKEEENPNVTTTSVNAYSVPYLFATKVERLEKRMGEARHAAGETDGHWVRISRTNEKLQGFDAEGTMVEVGYDVKKPTDEGFLLRGGAVSFLQSDADYTSISAGESETKRYRLSAYQTWFGDNGTYLDLIGRAGWYDSDFTMVYKDEASEEIKGELDLWAASLSVETGHKLRSEKGLFAEPQLQLQYTYLDDTSYTSSNGVKTRNGNVDSLIGRFGVRLGFDAYEAPEKFVTGYVRGDVMREFLGDREFSMQGTGDERRLYNRYDGDRCWYDLGFGMTGRFGKTTFLFVDVERQFGSGIDRIWEVNGGVRWLFY